MTTTKPTPPSHLHAFNFHTGHPRFHFDEAGAGGADAAAAAAAAAIAAAAAAAAKTPWHAGIEAEIIGHAQNKGWKIDDPKEAFSAAAKVARDLEKHFGVPADRLAKIPAADAAPADIRAFYERLGAPKAATEYDFSAIKDAGGNALATPIVDALRASAFDRGLTKDAAVTIAQNVVKAIDGLEATKSAERTAKAAEAKAELTKNWGPSFEYNRLKAMDGARRLGIDPETVATFESLIGYAGIMETLRKIGVGTTEDTFIDRGVLSNGQVTTREGALARKAELMGDAAWAKRYLEGGAAEKREMTALNTMIDGVAA
jgi:hypothetical protein